MSRRSWITALLCIALIAAACSGGDDSASESSDAITTTEAPSTTEAETTEPETTEVTASEVDPSNLLDIDMPVDSALALSLEMLNGRDLTEAEYEAVFSDEFKQQLSFEQFSLASTQLQSAGPFTMGEEIERAEDAVQVEIVDNAGDAWFIGLQVVVADDVRMAGLFAGPQPEIPDVAGFDDGIAQLQERGTVRFATFETTGGSCEAIDSLGLDEPMPLGSVFKLYVLGAVVTAIDAGDVAWDDEVEVRAELFSIPSGITQNDEPGTMLTVRELADRMISISDNTATDHLIDLVGREAVEVAVAGYGHSAPELNRPFLTTKEFTILKFATDDETRAAYLAADEPGRRALIDELPAELPPVAAIATATDPVDVESIEWFASPSDICRVLVELGADPVARQVMSINPGIPGPPGTFSFLGFKGGSEPGVVATSWLVETADGRSFVIAGAVSNEDEAFDPTNAITLMSTLRDGVIDS